MKAKRPLSGIALLAVPMVLAVFSSASAQEIEVVGRIQVEASAEAKAGGTRISGRLLNELGRPIAGTLRFTPGEDSQHPLAYSACADDFKTDSVQAETGTDLATNALGDFCAYLQVEVAAPWAHATAPHHEPSHVQVPTDRANLSPPQFLNSPSTLNKSDALVVVVEVLAKLDIGPQGQPGKLDLILNCNEQQTLLATKAIEGSRIARFELVGQDWMPAGPCQLEAQLESWNHRKASAYAELLVQAPVDLRVASIEHSAEFAHIRLITSGSDRTVEGMVEAKSGGKSMSALPIDGSGEVQFQLGLEETVQRVSFVLSPFRPESRAGPPLELELPARPRPWRFWPWHLVGVTLFLGWIVHQWLWVHRSPSAAALVPASDPLNGLAPEKERKGAICGCTRDMHTGRPIPGVTVQLLELHAQEEREILCTVSDEVGRFCFDKTFAPHLLFNIRFSHSELMTLKTGLTAAEMDVALSSRRRAALEQLIDWAKRAGRPWDRAPTITTGHIAQLARTKHRTEITSWAEDVAKTAYGPEAPTEAEVGSLHERTPST